MTNSTHLHGCQIAEFAWSKFSFWYFWNIQNFLLLDSLFCISWVACDGLHCNMHSWIQKGGLTRNLLRVISEKLCQLAACQCQKCVLWVLALLLLTGLMSSDWQCFRGLKVSFFFEPSGIICSLALWPINRHMGKKPALASASRSLNFSNKSPASALAQSYFLSVASGFILGFPKMKSLVWASYLGFPKMTRLRPALWDFSWSLFSFFLTNF